MRNENLFSARCIIGKTQSQVAREAGITERMYQYYEAGEKEPGVKTAIRIADSLEVTDLRELFADSFDQRPI